MNIIFIAPPAVGKGTQSSLLKEKLGYLHLSTGDLLRSEIKKQNDLGTKIENIISKGELVSDEIITELLKNEFKKISDKRFILDGYPRNINQAEILTELFAETNIDNYIAIYLDLDEETALKRALGRVVCSNCGESYNIYFQNLQPKENEICDKCHSKLIKRSDDDEETFRKRFNTYLEVTNPLLDYYKKQNRLYIIDANQDSNQIFADIESILESESVDN